MLATASPPISEHQARPLTRMRAPGTCGEFVQGAIDGRDFLVNCPVDLYSYASVYDSVAPGLQLSNAGSFNKIADAISLATQEFLLDLRHRVSIRSDIPRGKGMASSTADLTAALAALCHSVALPLTPQAFARLLTEIEPSDCTHFEGIAHVNHLTGDLLDSLPAPDGMRVLVVDCGGEIDTIDFDRERARHVYRQQPHAIREALDLLKRGLRQHNPQWVADGATLSAQISQQIHFKPQFEELLQVARRWGALGVNCAHSGSVLGVLYRASDRLKDSLRTQVENHFGRTLAVVGDHAIISGGYREC